MITARQNESFVLRHFFTAFQIVKEQVRWRYASEQLKVKSSK